MAGKKQYGLIIPSKCKQIIKRPSLFDDNSEEECEEPQQKLDTWKSKVKKKTHLEIQKVLEEDPTVYEYDSIYDDMQKKKAERKEVFIKDRKPKYIGSLMKAAEIRKKEYERRIERQIQKEREKEGNEFENKEAFVTSSYKKKLLERQEEEERERRQKELEERMDVTKQNDLSGFYRHFLKQTTGEEQIPTIDDDREQKESNIEESEKIVEDNKLSLELKRAKQAIIKLKQNSSKKHINNSSNSSSLSSDDDDDYREKKHHNYYSKSKSGDYNIDSDNQRRHIKKQKYTDSKYRRKNSSLSEDERCEKKEKHRSVSKHKNNHYHKRKYESSHSSNHKKRSHKSNKPDYSSDSCS